MKEAKKKSPTTKSKEEKPLEELAILPLKNGVVYPNAMMPITIGQERSIKLVDDALVKEKIIGIVPVKNADIEVPNPEDLYTMGCSAHILKMMKLPENHMSVLVQGQSRIHIKEYTQTLPYLKAKIDIIKEEFEKEVETEALMVSIKNLFQKAVELSPHIPAEVGILVMNMDNPGTLADLIASNFNISVGEKQEILEILDIKKRLEKVVSILNKELHVLELGSKIQGELKKEMDKNQREYYLREQLKAIQRELGEEDERTVEVTELKEKIEKSKMPKEVNGVAQKELDRLSKMPPAAAEYTVSRTYLDWLIELPWSVATEDNLDIDEAQKVLDEDHYGLEKVKKRILEYLAVRKLKADMKGPILCFVGPPGTGKTSLGKSIARALGRKFIRLSLGGVRDEAEIRGHRRTYVGALPGRIIQGIKKAGSHNPVFMLDEIDKLGMDFRGDPSSALLEVLDPEQNFSFSDHYLEVPFDLSNVMFITTANILDTIPPALRDRMEILELPGYTEEEKRMIAQKYLMSRQLEAHGLTSENLSFEDDAVKAIISDYTREAGLRNLEREIATICRGVAKEYAQGKKEAVVVNKERLHSFLGPIKFFSEIAERTSVPGVATGLAWTPTGGDIIFVEATKMKGKKSLALTGSLGDVMKESAQAALSYIRSNTKDLSVPEDFFEENDIHLHVPAGAIPKDGPSAGVTMFAALTSLLTDRPVRSDIAMTGEITLRGLVLPVGGIKEKVLAAKRAGLNRIILPKKNENNLEEIPENVKKGMKFYFIEKMDQVIEHALV
ncbi:MAG: endopeptidase La [Thermodesulfobacteriota bacterium]